jgi:hypothetical protein
VPLRQRLSGNVKRPLWVLASCLLLVLVVWAGQMGLPHLRLRARVDQSTYESLKVGMTRDEVEGVIGGPPGDYSHLWVRETRGRREDLIPNEWPPVGIDCSVWRQGKYVLVVAYEADKLRDKLLASSVSSRGALWLLHSRIAGAVFRWDARQVDMEAHAFDRGRNQVNGSQKGN